jgi:hypothetical protein
MANLLPLKAREQSGKTLLWLNRPQRTNDRQWNQLFQGSLRHGEHYITQEIERRGISPVQVVEEEKERSVLRQGNKNTRNRQKDEELILLRLLCGEYTGYRRDEIHPTEEPMQNCGFIVKCVLHLCRQLL